MDHNSTTSATMEDDDLTSKFHWVDYLLFAISLGVSVFVGIFLAVKQNFVKQSSEDYLMANRQMNWLLVSMSILATAMNALIFVGFTSEFYYYGFTAVWLVVCNYVAIAPTAIFIIPKFYRMGYKLTSAYSYFQYRFNLVVRMAVSFLYFLLTLLFLAVVLYIPSLVMAQVSKVNVYFSILLGAGVCLLYTAFGGMKAVIWVDNIQVLIITVGTFTLAIKGSIDAGGITEVWKIYSGIGERNNWNDINPEPWDRHNVWNVIFLLGLSFGSRFACDQALLQRYMTVPNMRHSQKSLVVGLSMVIAFLGVVMVMAMVAFASLGGNEPLKTDKIKAPGQIMPYFLMRILGEYHGIPGLFVAAVFAAALSTVSSGQTGLAAVFLEDFVKPIHHKCTGRTLSDKTSSNISKIVGIGVGVAILAIAMGVPNMGSRLVDMALSFQAFILGPIMGLMVVGFWFFWVESCGALVGLLVAVAWTMMLYFGNLEHGQKMGLDRAPLFLDDFNITIRNPNPTVEPTIWDISYTWYTFTAVLIVMGVSSIVSLIVHGVVKISHKDYGIKDMMPPDDLRYTMDDFLVAMGCRKNNKNMVEEQDYETSLHRNADFNSKDLGEDNLALEKTEKLDSIKAVDDITITHL